MARCIIAGVVVTYLLGVLQTTFGAVIAVYDVAPDLLFVWTVCIGLLSGRTAGAVVGFGSGLLEGGLQQTWIGALGVSKMVSGFAAGLLGAKMFKENWLVPAVCAGLLTVVNETIFLLLSRAGDWSQAGRILGVRALYHAVLAPFAFALAVRARRALQGRQIEAA